MSVHLVVKVQEDLYDLICEVAKARGEDICDLVRRTVRKELAVLYNLPEEKKALDRRCNRFCISLLSFYFSLSNIYDNTVS